MVAAQGNYMITPYNFFIYDSTNWILDTESSINICNSLQGLQVRRRFNNNERFLIIGDGRLVPVQALGVIEFVFESGVVMLNDCHFCPTFMMNVISVGLLAKAGYEILIKENYCNIILNDIIIFYG